MFSYLPISYLNDFSFCPYSIYLHNVYKGGEDELYHATPQTEGRNAHQSVDEQEKKTGSADDIVGMEIYSTELGLMGKIDLYRTASRLLIERKNYLPQIFQGQLWQIHAQYFAMLEMGYAVAGLAFYSMKDNRTHSLHLPTHKEKKELQDTIRHIKNIHVLNNVRINPNKCAHCIYNNLCDKAPVENVY